MSTAISPTSQDNSWWYPGRPPRNCREIVAKYLQTNLCDGLATDNCGCGLEDLMPCGEDFSRCIPAKKKGGIWVPR